MSGEGAGAAALRDLFGQVYDTLTVWAEATAEYARAEDLWRDSAGADDARTLDTQARRALAMINVAQRDDAERVLGDLVPRLERLYGRDDPRRLSVYRSVALMHLLRGRRDEAEQLLLDLRVHPRLADDDAAQVGILAGLVSVHTNRMTTLDLERGRALLLQAEPLAVELVERAARLHGRDSTRALHARVNVGMPGLQDGPAPVGCRRVPRHPRAFGSTLGHVSPRQGQRDVHPG